jgi:hypothetical protein
LNDRFEEADGNVTQLEALDKSWILEQARLDAVALLHEAGEQGKGQPLAELLSRLDQAGLRVASRNGP